MRSAVSDQLTFGRRKGLQRGSCIRYEPGQAHYTDPFGMKTFRRTQFAMQFLSPWLRQ